MAVLTAPSVKKDPKQAIDTKKETYPQGENPNQTDSMLMANSI